MEVQDGFDVPDAPSVDLDVVALDEAVSADDAGGVTEPGPSDAEAAPADEAGVAEVPEAGCQTGDDCKDVVGPLGPCEVAVCLDGQCGTAQAPVGTPCAGDGNPCTLDQCNDQGACVHDPITCLDPPANACDGNVLVTFASPGQCDRGQCEYFKTEKPCASGCTVDDSGAHCAGEDPCTGVPCDVAPFACLKVPGHCENGSCVFEYDDGASCEDGDPCTTSDRCAQGVCAGTLLECNAPPPAVCRDATTLQTYSMPGSCVGGQCEYAVTEVVCANGCEVGRDGVAHCAGQVDPCEGVDCSTAPSACLKSPGQCVKGGCVFEVNDGVACEDGNLCTVGDSCLQGTCLSGVATVCDDKNPCTDDSCNPDTGQCETTNNTLSCDDGDLCTVEDTCAGGACHGSPMVCNTPPPSECVDFETVKTYQSAGQCNPETGLCEYQWSLSTCPTGFCIYGACTGEETVVGFFEAGGGGTADGSFAGTLGSWTEGRCIAGQGVSLCPGW